MPTVPDYMEEARGMPYIITSNGDLIYAGNQREIYDRLQGQLRAQRRPFVAGTTETTAPEPADTYGGIGDLFGEPQQQTQPAQPTQSRGTVPGSAGTIRTSPRRQQRTSRPGPIHQREPWANVNQIRYDTPWGPYVQNLVGEPSAFPHVLNGVPMNPQAVMAPWLNPWLNYPGAQRASTQRSGGGGGTRRTTAANQQQPPSTGRPAPMLVPAQQLREREQQLGIGYNASSPSPTQASNTTTRPSIPLSSTLSPEEPLWSPVNRTQRAAEIRRMQEQEDFQRRNDELLRNILPEEDFDIYRRYNPVSALTPVTPQNPVVDVSNLYAALLASQSGIV